MRRDARVLLWDARDAGEQATAFVDGRTLSDYEADPMLRSAVERQLIIVGEALNHLDRHFPEMAGRVPNLSEIIGFRNVLVHGYAVIDDQRVWQIATERVPGLIRVVAELIDEGNAR